jgi:hypothetical protein
VTNEEGIGRFRTAAGILEARDGFAALAGARFEFLKPLAN